MATVAACIIKNDIKADKTWNVKIRIWHNSKSAYIDTIHFVGKKQVGNKSKTSTSLVIKDDFVLDLVAPVLAKYRKWISEHESSVESMTAGELRDALLNSDKPVESIDKIDFIDFSYGHIERMKKAGKESSTRTLVTVINSLVDYFKRDIIDVSEIRYSFLMDYELYLKGDREMLRKNHNGEMIASKQKGLSKGSLHNHMRDLRLLFNAARNYFNDEDSGVIKIKHYPFKKYKVGKPPITANRNRSVEEIIKIRDCNPDPGSRGEQARDLFMLSFYMCGMNAADMFELNETVGSRVEYRRSKTRSRRTDEAFISIKVTDEAEPLLEKYAGKLQVRYSATSGLNSALDKGLKVISELTGIADIDFYDARHSVGDLARNVCGYSKSDVGEALNHYEDETRVTDTYISKSWDLIDRMQESVVSLIRSTSFDVVQTES